MVRIPPLSDSDETDEKTTRTLERIKELLDTDTVPQPFLVYGRVPAFLQDFYMNFKKYVHGEGKLDAKTRTIIALSVSAMMGSDPWTNYFEDRAQQFEIGEGTVAEILAVASTNYMYNTFFKFRSISGSDAFEGLPVGLRAHTFSGTSLDDATVELINIAISDLNACKPCVSGHVDKARKLGVSNEAILEAIQCTSVMMAGIQFLKSAGF
ncbi:MAG: carboxymuconolactone decarboxylase family protein [Planctomycetaceae bacterium]|nr:carboxymuconolactone decarboxylase family protein [Planctomycetaceae bacterium]